MLSELGEREAALAAAREAVELYRALAAQRPDAFRPDLAMSLNNLAAMLSELGEREAALAAAREAVELRRALAAQRPDAFRPDLATSLMVRALCLDAADQPAPALADNVEAIGVLTPAFVRLPPAFAQLMGAMVRAYRQRCEKHGTEPDQALLTPVIAAFNQLPGQKTEEE
jgi:tetratricopeptide (TPR) repeat protein